ncbi:hypothetical protein BGX34_006665, partial [Mortierella sp. NVP85]
AKDQESVQIDGQGADTKPETSCAEQLGSSTLEPANIMEHGRLHCARGYLQVCTSVLSNFGKLKRTKTTQVFSGIGKGRGVSSPSLLLTANMTGSGSGSEEPPPMILLVHRSEVLEKFFARGGSDEVDCVWRPQNGLVYQRIICPKCSRAKQISQVFMGSSSSGRSPSGSRSDTFKQPHPIVGLNGVLIVGRSDMEPAEDEDTEGIGTIWLTAEEIRLL